MKILIPKLSLVVLIGSSGSGKSTFARKHFRATEILSSDACRGIVCDDETSLAATNDAFAVLHYIAAKRLANGRLTVIDATNVQPESRKALIELARQYHVLPAAIVLNLPERLCHERNSTRSDRQFGPHVVRNQQRQLRSSLRGLGREGFRKVYVLESLAEVDAAVIEREPMWTDKADECGPFDIIGDIHGCCDELEELLLKLGYTPQNAGPDDPVWGNRSFAHPGGRKAIFLGDLVDRGPRIIDTLRLVRNMVHGGAAFCVPGNHDIKLLRKLLGKNVNITHGLDSTLAEIDALSEATRAAFCEQTANFLDGLISHYVLDEGRLVVAHAGMKQEMQGRGSRGVREFALYGETTGETDEFGLPVRYNWAADYRGNAMVVYGHTPVPQPEWLNQTINIDTGCVYGGNLTALRYPEREFVSVPARRTYCVPSRPFLAEGSQETLTAQQQQDQVLDADDVLGKRIISTRLRGNVAIREANATAALEVMSRFAANPKWLIYLPPTMSPCGTTAEPGLLEHPAEAFAYYRNQGVPKVVCEEKHMGSRAIVVICRDEEAARQRFGIAEAEHGIVYTRTGRRFFNDADLERRFLARINAALTASDFWNEFGTQWACLDCELMPWSAKAQELLRNQYAAVGASGRVSLPRSTEALALALGRLTGEEKAKADAVANAARQKEENVARFTSAYRQYCWKVETLTDLKLAPFHLLATESCVHIDKTHTWHMDVLAKICREDEQLLKATPYRVVDVTDPVCQAEGIAWWTSLTEAGGEGMVVKPLEFLVRGQHGLVQPAVKCRGREYLRIIYGPDYTSNENLSRLRSRGLSHKRSLAIAELALGLEGLERFVRHEPLRRVHECVFGVLAMESEPVDPRL